MEDVSNPIQFNLLPPGRYRIDLISANSDGVKSFAKESLFFSDQTSLVQNLVGQRHRRPDRYSNGLWLVPVPGQSGRETRNFQAKRSGVQAKGSRIQTTGSRNRNCRAAPPNESPFHFQQHELDQQLYSAQRHRYCQRLSPAVFSPHAYHPGTIRAGFPT